MKPIEVFEEGQLVEADGDVIYVNVDVEIPSGARGRVVRVEGNGVLPHVRWDGRTDALPTIGADAIKGVEYRLCIECNGWHEADCSLRMDEADRIDAGRE